LERHEQFKIPWLEIGSFVVIFVTADNSQDYIIFFMARTDLWNGLFKRVQITFDSVLAWLTLNQPTPK